MGKLQDDSPILCLGHSSTSKDDKENTKFDESYEMWFDEFNQKSRCFVLNTKKSIMIESFQGT